MTKKTMATMLAGMMLMSSVSSAAYRTDFSDFPTDWSSRALSQAVENGLLQGYNGKINPAGKLTRAELAAIISRAFGAAEKASLSGFTDVDAGDWYYSDMAKAVQMGVLYGADGKLNPDDPITREEAFAVLARAFLLQDGNAATLAGFSDESSISSWAAKTTAAMVENGYVHGANGKLNGKSDITRAEIAQVLSTMVSDYVDKGETIGKTEGNILVRQDKMVLDGMTVEGDLVIADGVRSVSLKNTKVKGRIVIRGGLDRVKISGTAAEGVTIYNPNGRVVLDTADSAAGAVETKSDLLVEGKLDKLTITGKAAVTVGKNGSIKQVTAEAAGASVKGEGKVDKVLANANDVAVANKGAMVTAGKNTSGVKAGSAVVAPGTTVQVPIGGSSGGGGSSSGGSGGGNSGGGAVDPQVKEYKVQFAAGVDGTGAMDGVTVKSGDSCKLPENKFAAPKDHVFRVWSVKTGTAEAKEMKAGESVKITADTTVTAVWKKADIGEITITGAKPIDPMETTFIDDSVSSYDLPIEVELTLSNGNVTKAVVSGWVVENGLLQAGGTFQLRALLDGLAGEDQWNNFIDSETLQDVTVKMELTLTAAAPSTELDIRWDSSKTYNWDEDVVITLVNYTGDGTDISMDTYIGFGSTGPVLTDGSGLVFDAAKKTITIKSAAIHEKGVETYVSGDLHVGSKTFYPSISYTTNRSASFQDQFGNNSASYTDVSRKTAMEKTVTFTNVPDQDVKAAKYRFANGTEVTGVELRKDGEAEGAYKLVVPYASMADHLEMGNSVNFYIYISGMKEISVSIQYMGDPALTLNKSNGYYAAEDPVITLKNFTLAPDTMNNLVVTATEGAQAPASLQKDTDYTVDADKKTITLKTLSMLGTNTLDADRTLVIKIVGADSEQAQVEVKYTKDRAVAAQNVTNLTAGAAIRTKLSGSRDGYSGLKVFHESTELTGFNVKSANGEYTLEIPYAQVKSFFDAGDTITLTLRLTGSPDATFTVQQGTDNMSGAKLPIKAGVIGSSGGYELGEDQKQGPHYKMHYTGGFSLLIDTAAEGALSEDEWKNSSASLRMKDGDGTEIVLGTPDVLISYMNDKPKALAFSLFEHKAALNAIYDFESAQHTPDKADWPVFEVVLHKAGCQPVVVELVLYNGNIM